MSRQPTKQRNRTERAPLHEKHRQVRAHLAADLREEYDQRSVRVNVGDTVVVTRGDHAGEEGEVAEVDLRDAVVRVDGVFQEKADGEEVPLPLDASNLQVTDLDLGDDVRRARLEEDSE